MKSLKTILGIALSVGGLGTAATVTGVSIAQGNKAVIDSQVEAISSGDTVYFRTNNNWSGNSSRVSLYVYGSNNVNAWASMEKYDNFGVYKGTIPNKAGLTNIIFCSMNPNTTDNTWKDKWNQTNDLTYTTSGSLYKYNDNQWDNGSGSWVSSYGWGIHGKINGSSEWTDHEMSKNPSQFEYSFTANFKAGDIFKLNSTADAWLGWDNVDDADGSARKSGDVVESSDNKNIEIKTSGKYSIYVKPAASSKQIWIQFTSPSSEAYSYADYFLSHVGCDSTGQSAPSGWSNVASEYTNNVSDAAKLVIKDATGNKDGDSLAKCIFWYERALIQHPGLTAFMVERNSPSNQSVLSTIKTETNNNMVAIVVLSTTAVIAISGVFFLLRKKKHN